MSKNTPREKTDRKPSTGYAANPGSGKKVILITYPDQFMQEEAKGLVDAAGYKIVDVLTQKRLSNQQYGVGTGKAEEIRDIAEQKKSQMIVIDEEAFLFTSTQFG